MRLYRCQEDESVLEASTTTNSNGGYLFADLAPENWYYVEAVMSGPLAGMTPASGTMNPSVLLGLGDSDLGVDFAFE
jgi:hypothetical protein